jgi:hypothetical protein
MFSGVLAKNELPDPKARHAAETDQVARSTYRHRTQARVEDRVRCGKDTGLVRHGIHRV